MRRRADTKLFQRLKLSSNSRFWCTGNRILHVFLLAAFVYVLYGLWSFHIWSNTSIQSTIPQNEDSKYSLPPLESWQPLVNQGNTTWGSSPPISVACTIWMDDNHFLPEWLAYHYYTLRLRHVILAPDPRSRSNLEDLDIIHRWKGRMKIEIWNATTDNGKGHNFYNPSNYYVDKKFRDPHLRHQDRQAQFNIACLRHFHQLHYHTEQVDEESGQRRTVWVLLTDLDEYIFVSPDIWNNDSSLFSTLPPATITNRPSIEKPESVIEFLTDLKRYQHEREHEKQSSVVLAEMNSEEDYKRKACIKIQRRQYAPIENDEVDFTAMDNIMLKNTMDSKDFQTLRWSRYGYQKQKILQWNKKFRKQWKCPKPMYFPVGLYHQHGKVIIDLSQLSYSDLWETNNTKIGNPHIPLKKVCPKPWAGPEKDAYLVANHYTGTLEQWISRQGDARFQSRPRKFADLRDWYGKKSGHEIQPWLQSFVDILGVSTAQRLLDGAGKLRSRTSFLARSSKAFQSGDRVYLDYTKEGCEQNSTQSTTNQEGRIVSALPEIQMYSVLLFDSCETMWPVKEGCLSRGPVEKVPYTERCALCFFGLPRSFRSMVLPSIIQNILIPNADLNCDIFVHFYHQTEEQPGRLNKGGLIKPEEIYDLKPAMLESMQVPADGINTTILPTVVFTFDTNDSFLEKRGEDIERYLSTVGSNGEPLFYPYLAHTYQNSSLVNIVKQWHSIESVFSLMLKTSAERGLSYSRVAMLRSDVMYMTPISLKNLESNSERNGKTVTVPGFARTPVNDRMIYGPTEAIKIWATSRFTAIEEHVKLEVDPGYAMHSERFLNLSIFQSIEKSGYNILSDPNMCFLRTRVDDSVIISDCGMDDALVYQHQIEQMTKRKCRRFTDNKQFLFAQCTP